MMAVAVTPLKPLKSASLRWTPATVCIDLAEALADILGALSGFFERQAQSLAARASLKEALKDREIQHRLHTESRIQMQMHTMQDIAALPEIDTREHGA